MRSPPGAMDRVWSVPATTSRRSSDDAVETPPGTTGSQRHGHGHIRFSATVWAQHLTRNRRVDAPDVAVRNRAISAGARRSVSPTCGCWPNTHKFDRGTSTAWVVLPEQAEAIAAAAARRGIPDVHLAFYGPVMAFAPAGDLPTLDLG